MKIGPLVRPVRRIEKKRQDRTGQDSQKSHKGVIFHLFGEKTPVNRKTGNSTLCKIVTPKNISSNVCTRDYVGDGNYCAIFFVKIGLVGASPQIGEI